MSCCCISFHKRFDPALYPAAKCRWGKEKWRDRMVVMRRRDKILVPSVWFKSRRPEQFAKPIIHHPFLWPDMQLLGENSAWNMPPNQKKLTSMGIPDSCALQSDWVCKRGQAARLMHPGSLQATFHLCKPTDPSGGRWKDSRRNWTRRPGAWWLRLCITLNLLASSNPYGNMMMERRLQDGTFRYCIRIMLFFLQLMNQIESEPL